MFKEFEEFAMRGNVVDRAVAIIIGASFGRIVKSWVDDVLMPVIGLLLANVDFSNVYLVLKEGETMTPSAPLAEAKKMGAVTIHDGIFANSVISLLIVASAVFMWARTLTKLKSETPVAAPSAKACPNRTSMLEG